MTITGSARTLTDAQWVRLMEIVSDNQVIDLTMPSVENQDAVPIRAGRIWRIHPDGSAESKHWVGQPV